MKKIFSTLLTSMLLLSSAIPSISFADPNLVPDDSYIIVKKDKKGKMRTFVCYVYNGYGPYCIPE